MNLADSYRHCQKLAKSSAKNFYYSFLGLPAEQSRAMCVLYSYMRTCDDIGDEQTVPLMARRELLERWEAETRRTLDSDVFHSSTPSESTFSFDQLPSAAKNTWDAGLRVMPALSDMVSRYEIPHRYFFEVIEGVKQDLDHEEGIGKGIVCRYQTFEELADYCYHVAGVVGLCCIHIWGIRDNSAIDRAIDCGLAFQLTNILRDLAEDAEAGRVYLPAEELERFGYSAEQIRDQVMNQEYQALMEFQVTRAESYYESAQALNQHIEATGRPILSAMIRIYHGLLNEIRKRDFDVYSKRVSLPTWRKLLIAADAIIRRRFGRS